MQKERGKIEQMKQMVYHIGESFVVVNVHIVHIYYLRSTVIESPCFKSTGWLIISTQHHKKPKEQFSSECHLGSDHY